MNAPSVAAALAPEPIKVHAAGCVVWRPGLSGPEVALIHRPRYDDWSFPKGKLDSGESYLVAAVREVFEETGFHVLLGRRLPTQVYDVSFGGPHRMKRVKYWAAQAAADIDFEPNEEVDRLDWLPVPHALARLTRQTDVALLESFAAQPVDTVPVVLLRHATAVSRKQWPDEDRDRPLTIEGRADAQNLVTMIGAYGDTSLVASPMKRCVDTLKPTAKHTGTGLVREPALAEDADPDRAKSWLRHVLKAQRPIVACTHRPVIPDLLSESPLGLAIRAGRRALVPGEGWVLHAKDEVVVAIDRLRS